MKIDQYLYNAGDVNSTATDSRLTSERDVTPINIGLGYGRMKDEMKDEMKDDR